MSTHSSPATSLVYVAVLTHKKIVANVDPSIGVHVIVLVRTDYGSTLGLVRAESVGTPVVNYDGRHRPGHCGGCARWGSCAPLCSADNSRTCCGIKESLPILCLLDRASS